MSKGSGRNRSELKMSLTETELLSLRSKRNLRSKTAINKSHSFSEWLLFMLGAGGFELTVLFSGILSILNRKVVQVETGKEQEDER